MKKFHFHPLNKKIDEKIKKFLYQRFGYEMPKGWILYSQVPERISVLKYQRVYAFTGDIAFLKEKTKVESVGLFLGTWENENFRVSLEAGDLIGKNSTKNFIEMEEKDLKDWLGGKNLKKKYPKGVYLLRFKNYHLGGAYSNGKELLNFLPQVFKLELKETKKKKKSRVNVPKEFFVYSQKLPGFDPNLFLESLTAPPSYFAIRVNLLKTDSQKLFKEFPSVNFLPIPWAQNCFWVEEKNRWITKSLNFLLGEFYVQEAASLLAGLLLDPKPGESILDLCAAPGSKTTQIGEAMKQKGTIVANDSEIERVQILKTNIQKQGLMNVIVLNEDGRELNWKEKFDKVLVDAPCTALGTGVKSVAQWNFKTVRRLSDLQKQLIVAGFEMLKPGGKLVYSTCTITKEENEEIVQYLLKKYSGMIVLEEIEPKNIKFVPGTIKGVVRIYPYLNQTESFFVASLLKK